jgi:hypothetical protein
MLVHATRFIEVQEKIAMQVEDDLNGLRDVLDAGATADIRRIEEGMGAIWGKRMLAEHDAFHDALGSSCPELPAWTEVWARVPKVLEKAEVVRINGRSTDALAYTRAEEARWVIAVGGDKLSRGLTLEGLVVSYFLRASRMFDTLMQMGRWFGYRPGYADLCRVYTTKELYRGFREIALAMDDLRGELDYMAAVNKTPREFGLRVREPSDGLLITAPGKMREGQEVAVRFAGSLVQTLEIPCAGAQAYENRAAVEALLVELGEPTHEVRGEATAHSIWPHVPYRHVVDCLMRYEAVSTPCFYHRCEALRRYINERVAAGELGEWTVAVIGKRKGERWVVGGREFPIVDRARQEGDRDYFALRGLTLGEDEAIDLSREEYERALTHSGLAGAGERAPKTPARQAVRQARPASRGLLLLYLIANGVGLPPVPAVAISFPESQTATSLSYRVNQVWLEQRGLFGDE